MEQDLINVHECLVDAAQASKEEQKQPLVTASYKVSEEVKEAATEICIRNGTTLSEYLRKCTEALVIDYRG